MALLRILASRTPVVSAGARRAASSAAIVKYKKFGDLSVHPSLVTFVERDVLPGVPRATAPVTRQPRPPTHVCPPRGRHVHRPREVLGGLGRYRARPLAEERGAPRTARRAAGARSARAAYAPRPPPTGLTSQRSPLSPLLTSRTRRSPTPLATDPHCSPRPRRDLTRRARSTGGTRATRRPSTRPSTPSFSTPSATSPPTYATTRARTPD